MKLKTHTIGAQTITVAALLLLTACSQPEERHDRMRVVVTIPPLAEFVEKIGGEKVEVSIMVPPGASPHSYEPTPGQLADVAKAGVYVKVGTPIEFEIVWLDKLLATNSKITVCNASRGIDLIPVRDAHDHTSVIGHGHTNDPHVWVSPDNAGIMVANICQIMSAVDEKNRTHYEKNRDRYLFILDSLDQDIRRILKAKKQKRFLVYHPAWSYFARTYGIEQIAIEVEGKEPTAQVLQRIINQALKTGTRVIFASPQFNTKSAQVIAREIDGTVILIDPLARDYVANIGKIARMLADTME
jgi:zinc transport system substrate-binding protein